MTNKPQQILDLEKHLGFELTQVDSVDDIFQGRQKKSYLLDENNQVIGLNLYDCGLSDTSFLKSLTSLTSLHLFHNQISNISFLQGLTNLTELNLGGNIITDTSFLQNLTNLGLSCNQITDTSFLQALMNLTELDLSSSQITDISFLQGLTNLKELNLNENRITDISFLQDLTNLTELSLWNNQITDISFLQDLTNLTGLGLGYNSITDFSFLQDLTNLTGLGLSVIAITDYSFLLNFPNLTSLSLYRSPISDISFLQDLTNLTRLSLWENQISDISSLQGLTKLTDLCLRDNQIKDISILQSLTNLTKLSLWNNQITDISFLQDLTNLTELNLRENRITEITLDFLNKLPNLKRLDLYKNPIKNIEKEIIGSINCLREVRSYLEAQQKGVKKHFELKMILVGNGRVGKTSLITRWIDKVFDKQQASTHGIQIRQVDKNDLPRTADLADSIALNIWDFGGQDIYHATHRLFMRTRAIFVVCWDWETEHTPEQTENGIIYRNYTLPYWLDYAKELGDDSPIIVVRTKCEDSRFENEELKGKKELATQYGVKKFHNTDAETQTGYNGLERLVNKILNEKLQEHQGLNMPLQWWNVRQAIEKMRDNTTQRRNMMTHAEFTQLCENENLPLDTVDIFLHYLHNIGFLFYRKTYFIQEIIINQQWAIAAVYTLLDRSKTYFSTLRAKNGKFNLASLHEAWSAYSNEEQLLFIGFMKACYICFEIPAKNGEIWYAAPAFMAEEMSDGIAQNWDTPETDYFIRYEQRFLHYGNIQRFIVETHQWANIGEMWKNGTQLKDKQGNRALIQLIEPKKGDNQQPYIQVQVRGTDNPKMLLEDIRKRLEGILEGVAFTERVSVDGENFVLLYNLKQHDTRRNGTHIAAENGTQMEFGLFSAFLDRRDWEVEARNRGRDSDIMLSRLDFGFQNAPTTVINNYIQTENLAFNASQNATVNVIANNFVQNTYNIINEIRNNAIDVNDMEAMQARIEELQAALDAQLKIQDYAKYLEEIKNDWFPNRNRLHEETQNYLAKGLFYYENQKETNLQDYAAIVISMGKAVELELKLHIADTLTTQNLSNYLPLASTFPNIKNLVKNTKEYRFKFGEAYKYFVELKDASNESWFSIFSNTFIKPADVFNNSLFYEPLKKDADNSLPNMRNFAAHPQNDNAQNITE